MADLFYYLEEQETDLEEAVKIKKRIDPQERIKRKREYRAKKSKVKRTQRLRRRTIGYKKQQKKAKKMAKFGKTSSGKRMSTIINKR